MEKKLNIGLFIDTFYPMVDGVIQVVNNYAIRMKDIANVTVFAPKARKEFDDSKLGYKVVRCKILKIKGLDYDLPMPKFDKKFKKAIKEANLDIIHIHSPFSIGKMGAKFGKKHNIPVIATFHSQYKRDFKKATKSNFLTWIMTKSIVSVFNKADLLLTMNPACCDLIKEYGYKGKMQIIPNGTDLKPDVILDEEITTIKEKHKIKDEKVFINIGRLIKLKNIDFVIDVCNKLKEKEFNFKLLILGTGKDKEYFENKVNKLNLNDKIDFVGIVTDVKMKSAYLKFADLNIFPSFYDTDGIVKIEAATFGTPTIFAEGSIASSTCKNDFDGYVCKFEVEEFSNKIIEIFNNPEKYSSVCENTAKHMYVTWDNIVEDVYNIYNKEIMNKNQK